MIRLPEVLAAWQTPGFEASLRRALQRLGCAGLPLQAGLAAGSVALDDGIEVMVLDAVESAGCLHVDAGVFYRSLVAGCGCADDPSVVEPLTEYCQVRLRIEKPDAATSVSLLP